MDHGCQNPCLEYITLPQGCLHYESRAHPAPWICLSPGLRQQLLIEFHILHALLGLIAFAAHHQTDVLIIFLNILLVLQTILAARRVICIPAFSSLARYIILADFRKTTGGSGCPCLESPPPFHCVRNG